LTLIDPSDLRNRVAAFELVFVTGASTTIWKPPPANALFVVQRVTLVPAFRALFSVLARM
jgi:hypothetical protein